MSNKFNYTDVHVGLATIRTRALFQAEIAIENQKYCDYLHAKEYYRMANDIISKNFSYIDGLMSSTLPGYDRSFPEWEERKNSALQDLEKMTEKTVVVFSDGSKVECEDVPF